MSSRTVTLTVGISASGKSTWARSMVQATGGDVVVVSRDDIRLSQGLPHGANEGLVTQLERAYIKASLELGKDVIIADTNVNQRFRDNLVQYCNRLGADVVLTFFPIELDEAILRDSRRGAASVGADVIIRQYEELRKQDLSVQVYRA